MSDGDDGDDASCTCTTHARLVALLDDPPPWTARLLPRCTAAAGTCSHGAHVTVVAEHLAPAASGAGCCMRLAVEATTSLWRVYMAAAAARPEAARWAPFSLLVLPAATPVSNWEATVSEAGVLDGALLATQAALPGTKVVCVEAGVNSTRFGSVCAPVGDALLVLASRQAPRVAAYTYESLETAAPAALRAAARLATQADGDAAAARGIMLVEAACKAVRIVMDVPTAAAGVVATFMAVRRLGHGVSPLDDYVDFFAARLVPALEALAPYKASPPWLEEVGDAAAEASAAPACASPTARMSFPLTWLSLLLLQPRMPHKARFGSLLAYQSLAYDLEAPNSDDRMTTFLGHAARGRALDTLHADVVEPALAALPPLPPDDADAWVAFWAATPHRAAWLLLASMAPTRLPLVAPTTLSVLLKHRAPAVRAMAAFAVLRRPAESAWLESMDDDAAADAVVRAALAWTMADGAPHPFALQYSRALPLPLRAVVRRGAGGEWPTATGLALLRSRRVATAVLGAEFLRALPDPVVQTARACFSFTYDGADSVAWAPDHYAREHGGAPHVDVIMGDAIERGTRCVAYLGCLHFFPAATLYAAVRVGRTPPLQCPFCKTRSAPDDGLARNAVLLPDAGSVGANPVAAARFLAHLASQRTHAHEEPTRTPLAAIVPTRPTPTVPATTTAGTTTALTVPTTNATLTPSASPAIPTMAFMSSSRVLRTLLVLPGVSREPERELESASAPIPSVSSITATVVLTRRRGNVVSDTLNASYTMHDAREMSNAMWALADINSAEGEAVAGIDDGGSVVTAIATVRVTHVDGSTHVVQRMITTPLAIVQALRSAGIDDAGSDDAGSASESDLDMGSASSEDGDGDGDGDGDNYDAIGATITETVRRADDTYEEVTRTITDAAELRELLSNADPHTTTLETVLLRADADGAMEIVDAATLPLPQGGTGRGLNPRAVLDAALARVRRAV